jgi:hypothetical protein
MCVYNSEFTSRIAKLVFRVSLKISSQIRDVLLLRVGLLQPHRRLPNPQQQLSRVMSQLISSMLQLLWVLVVETLRPVARGIFLVQVELADPELQVLREVLAI